MCDRVCDLDGMLVPLPGTNLDGIEGSSIAGGCYVARYGGGDDYLAADPLLSLVTPMVPVDWKSWSSISQSLERLEASSLQWPHGFSEAGQQCLPGGRAPEASSLAWDNVQLLVTQPPMSSPDGALHFSLMLHGWLFRNFRAQSDRKAHQKFPLLAIFEPNNLSMPDAAAGPEWLRTDGSFQWADQHVHRDEPVDLGGFLFSEVFVGSDMARARIRDPAEVASFWLAAVDCETGAGLLTLCIVLPHGVANAAALREDAHGASSLAKALGTLLPSGETTKAACTALASLEPAQTHGERAEGA